MQYAKIESGLVIRLKNYNRYNKPEHWTNDMVIDLQGRLFRIKQKYIWDNTPRERVRLRYINSDETVPYFFSVNDLVKANEMFQEK